MDTLAGAALVTGGASGLGAATARLLASRGAKVFTVDVADPHGDPISGVTHIRADLRETAEVEHVLDRLEETGEPVRGVVNCAGVRSSDPLLRPESGDPLESFRRVVEINLLGTFNVVRLAAPRMARNQLDSRGERGAIVNTASIAAFESLPGQSAYAASKAGVAAMTLGHARELGEVRIRVNCIAPGAMETPMMDSIPEERRQMFYASVPCPRRFGTPDEFAQAAYFLLTHPYMNGETLRLDGGLRMTWQAQLRDERLQG